MNVSAVGSKLQSSVSAIFGGSSQASTGKTLDYNSFLQLLIAQMQNQDPLEPMKSSDYVAQLATFSQVEKSVEMNARLSDLLGAVQLQQAASMIGQTVTSADQSVSGIVASARIVDGLVIATLTNGQELVIDQSVEVSRTNGGNST